MLQKNAYCHGILAFSSIIGDVLGIYFKKSKYNNILRIGWLIQKLKDNKKTNEKRFRN